MFSKKCVSSQEEAKNRREVRIEEEIVNLGPLEDISHHDHLEDLCDLDHLEDLSQLDHIAL